MGSGSSNDIVSNLAVSSARIVCGDISAFGAIGCYTRDEASSDRQPGRTIEIHLAVMEPGDSRRGYSDLGESICEAGCREYSEGELWPGAPTYLVSNEAAATLAFDDVEQLSLARRKTPSGGDRFLLAATLVVDVSGMVGTLDGAWLYGATFSGGRLIGIAPLGTYGDSLVLGVFRDKRSATEAIIQLPGIPLVNMSDRE